ncbi:MAG TPA: M55 family metallopeptidase [Vicinamibacterales bacterium]|nr:M55 family metallopeptidase [Vicinamibacterales bacterium]
MRRIMLTSLVLACLAYQPAHTQTRKLKVHISVDMEGIAGVVTGDQLGPEGFEYGRFREFMTQEALAAVTAAKEAGATEIVVADAHGNGENLLVEQFPPDVRIVRSWPRKLQMMAGIDSTFDAAVFIGYHASTTNPAGVRAHTFSSANLARVTLNGVEMSEGAWNAAIAGHFNVPIVMVSGDDAAVTEIRAVVGNLEGVETKRTLGFHAALTLTPQAVQAQIGPAVKAGLARRASFMPYKPQGPIVVDVTFKNYMPAEVLAFLPMFERSSAHSVRFHAKDMAEAAAVMEFIGEYRPDLAP